MASGDGLPRRLVASVTNSIDAASQLPEVTDELLMRLRSIDEHMQTLLETIVSQREDVATIETRTASLERSVVAIDGRIAEVYERLPDPDAPGVVEKAKDAITGHDS